MLGRSVVIIVIIVVVRVEGVHGLQKCCDGELQGIVPGQGVRLGRRWMVRALDAEEV